MAFLTDFCCILGFSARGIAISMTTSSSRMSRTLVLGGLGLALAAPVFGWTDDPLTSGGTRVRQVHIDELRMAINNKRTEYGLASVPWTDPSLSAGLSPIRKVHLDE